MADKKREDELLNHNYDGIQEYDNDLPRWWVWLFIITIAWSGVYVFWFHSQPTPTEQLATQMAELAALNKTSAAAVPELSDEAMVALSKDAKILAVGSGVFAAKCLACHGAQGQGLIGPNLTDASWIHGGKPAEIRKVIEEGVLPKGMLAWKSMLSHDEITSLVAYVMSLQGTNPPNPKPAEGTIAQ